MMYAFLPKVLAFVRGCIWTGEDTLLLLSSSEGTEACSCATAKRTKSITTFSAASKIVSLSTGQDCACCLVPACPLLMQRSSHHWGSGQSIAMPRPISKLLHMDMSQKSNLTVDKRTLPDIFHIPARKQTPVLVADHSLQASKSPQIDMTNKYKSFLKHWPGAPS